MKSVKPRSADRPALRDPRLFSMSAFNQRRGAVVASFGVNAPQQSTHLNPVRAGLVSRREDGRWSSYNEYASLSADGQKKRCGLIVDRVRMPSAPRARI
jgi:hypothetical protein